MIVPYTTIDGIATFQDSVIMGMYDRIIEEGKGYIFQDGSIPDREAFLLAMKNPGTYLYACYHEEAIVLIVWLNRLEPSSARLNFCVFNGVPVRVSIRLAKELIERLCYNFDVLIGYTPSSNEQAIRYIGLCGAKTIGEVPNLVWNESKGRSEPGVISYFRNEERL